jgi:hypothetical protein
MDTILKDKRMDTILKDQRMDIILKEKLRSAISPQGPDYYPCRR